VRTQEAKKVEFPPPLLAGFRIGLYARDPLPFPIFVESAGHFLVKPLFSDIQLSQGKFCESQPQSDPKWSPNVPWKAHRSLRRYQRIPTKSPLICSAKSVWFRFENNRLREIIPLSCKTCRALFTGKILLVFCNFGIETPQILWYFAILAILPF